MRYVYLLQHAYQYGKNDEHEEIKLLGIYTSPHKAKNAVDFYKNLTGFREYSDECFYIDKFELNKGEWTEGFIENECKRGRV